MTTFLATLFIRALMKQSTFLRLIFSSPLELTKTFLLILASALLNIFISENVAWIEPVRLVHLLICLSIRETQGEMMNSAENPT